MSNEKYKINKKGSSAQIISNYPKQCYFGDLTDIP